MVTSEICIQMSASSVLSSSELPTELSILILGQLAAGYIFHYYFLFL
jgi:hypothetical protein